MNSLSLGDLRAICLTVTRGTLTPGRRGLRPLVHRNRTALALARRVRYVAAFIYWTLRHRSIELGSWVAAYDCGEAGK